MEIQEFVSKALVQITRGILNANEQLREEVSRPDLNAFGLSAGQRDSEGQGIEFDLAVVTRNNTQASGSTGVLEVIGIGLKGEAMKGNENTSRVRFRVSVDQWLGPPKKMDEEDTSQS